MKHIQGSSSTTSTAIQTDPPQIQLDRITKDALAETRFTMESFSDRGDSWKVLSGLFTTTSKALPHDVLMRRLTIASDFWWWAMCDVCTAEHNTRDLLPYPSLLPGQQVPFYGREDREETFTDWRDLLGYARDIRFLCREVDTHKLGILREKVWVGVQNLLVFRQKLDQAWRGQVGDHRKELQGWCEVFGDRWQEKIENEAAELKNKAKGQMVDTICCE
ncbi:hypothetical protein EDC01DRAFT_635187 [Geopyxis carbonaria]|nr:hypothetical protein EDC01DRAFT_635187 [Geopyxis carbonaria]